MRSHNAAPGTRRVDPEAEGASGASMPPSEPRKEGLERAAWLPLARATTVRRWGRRAGTVAPSVAATSRRGLLFFRVVWAIMQRRVSTAMRDLRRIGVWPEQFARHYPATFAAIAVAVLLGTPLAIFLVTARSTSAAVLKVGTGAQATLITAEKGAQISSFTALAVQPSIEEANPGEIRTGKIVLLAPSGFVFDTGVPTASVTVSPLSGQTTQTCDTSAIGTGTKADLTSLTSAAILVTVTRESSGTSKCLMTFANLRVRPTTTTAPSFGSITKSSSGYSNPSVIAGVTDGVTSFGDIKTVASTWSSVNSPTTSTLSINRSQVSLGGSTEATITLKDQYGNTLTKDACVDKNDNCSIAQVQSAVGTVSFGTRTTAPATADCSTTSSLDVKFEQDNVGNYVVKKTLNFGSAGSLYIFACITSGGTTTFVTSTAQVTVNAVPTITSVEITRQLADQSTSNGTTIGVSGSARTRTVTVKGTGFAAGVTAAFDGNGLTAGTVTRTDASTLTISTSIAANAMAGGRSVTVTNPDGGTVSLANALTLTSPPSAAALSQTVYGSGAISVPLTLTGSNILTGARVRFEPNSGDIVFTSVVNSTTQVTVTMTIASTARATAERRTVYLDNRDESGEVAALTQLQINAPPTVLVTAISPNVLGQGAGTGSSSGNCTSGAQKRIVTIPGTGFSAPAPGLNLESVQATFLPSNDVTTEVTEVTSTLITVKVCVTNSATLGTRSLAVVNGDGGRVTVPNALTITGSPLLVSASEASIGQGASQRVLTFTGAGFSPTATLALQRVATSPRSFEQCGTPNVSLPGELTTVVGATVVVTARTTSTLTAQVTIDADALTGPVWIAVDNDDGGTSPKCALTGALTITPRPTVAGVSPRDLTPPTSGSSTVTIALDGANFGSGTTVAIGPASGQTVADVVASSPQVASSSRMTFVATVPSTAYGGPRDLTITNLDGGRKLVASAISVVTTGAVTVTPTSIGAGAVLAALTITGTGLNPASSVTFANATGTDVTGAQITAGAITSGPSGTSLIVPVTILSSSTPGTYVVTVTSPEGLATTGSFTVTAAPTISTIGRAASSAATVAVSFGQASSGQSLYLGGSGFATTGGVPVVAAINGAGAAVPGITISGVTVASGGASLTATVAVEATVTVGTYALQVTNPDLGRATLGSVFTVAAKPTLIGITDNNNYGAGASDRTVTLSGTGLISGASVKFTRTGDTTGAQVTVDSIVSSGPDTQLSMRITIATTATTGLRSITVTNPDGGSATLVDAFTINPAPVISSITPAGLGAGRTYLVTMRGSNLQSSNVAVTVGNGTNYSPTVNMSIDSAVGVPTRVNSTTVTFGIRIDALAPVGYRLITLTNLDGGVASTPFYVNAALAFSAVSPATVGIGSVAYAINVTGQGFSTSGLTPKIRFLNESTLVADPLIAVDDTKTSVNSDGTAASVLVTVASSATLGARALSIDLQDGTPLIVTRSSLSCGQGSASAGQPTPTPTATCFVFSVVGGPTITAVSPRGRRIGAVDTTYPTVTPTTTAVAGGPTATHTMTPSPTATLVPGQSAAPICPQPSEPSPPSTMRIAVCGSNFDTGATVSVTYPDSASTAANGITVVATERKSSTLLWVLLKFDVTGTGATTAVAGKRTITVTNGDGGTGSLLSSSSYAFEVVAPPTLTGVAFTGTPTAGQTVQLGIGAKDKQVQIAGTGFVAGSRTTVQVSAAGSSQPSAYIQVSSVIVNSSTSMTATMSVDAAAPTGARKIILTNDDGGASITSTLDLISIVNGPTFTSISLADVTGRTFVGKGATSVSLAITGSGFGNQPTVSFGAGSGITVKPGLAAESGAAIRGQIDVDAGATPGPRDLTVTNTDGGSFTVVGAITVNPSASLTGVSPTSLGIGATGTVTVSGANFRPQATISFRLNDQTDSTITVQSVTWVSESRIDAVVKVASNAIPGNRSLVFDNGDRSPLIVTAGGTFSINSGPQFVYMSPDAIAQGSSVTDVVIAGTGFLPSLTVTFSGAGVTAGPVTYVSASVVKVTITVADGAEASVRDVILDNGDGSSVVTAPSRFTVVGGLVVASVAPDSAVPGATLQVTITGNGYAPPATVSFGDGVTVSNAVVKSAAEITADLAVDAGAGPGPRSVSVTVNGKTASGSNKFTVLGAPPPTAVPSPPGGGSGTGGAAAKPTAVPTATALPTETAIPTITPIPTATPYGLVGQANGITLQAAVAPAGQVGEASLGPNQQSQSAVNFVAPSGIGVAAVVEARDPKTVTSGNPVLVEAAKTPAPEVPSNVELRRSIQVNLYDNVSGRKLVEHQDPVIVRLAFDAADFEAAGSDPDRMGIVIVRTAEEATPACPAGVFVLPARFDGDAKTLTISTLCTSTFSLAVLSEGPTDQDFQIQGGRFYTQANGFGARGAVGYAVIDDGQSSFQTEFTRRGGVKALGYPASRRFVRDGFQTQVFQRYVLQWRPDRNEALFVNVFDDLHERGYDSILENRYNIPPPFDIGPDEGLTFQEVVRLHVGNIMTGRDLAGNDIPDLDPGVMRALANYVFSDDDWMSHYGLPVSVARLPTSVVLRMQRASFQYWLEDVPFARAGQVTTMLGGDIAKAVGLYRNEEIAPELSEAYQRVPGPGATTPKPETSARSSTDGLVGAVAPVWNAVVQGVRRLLPEWLITPTRASAPTRPGVT
jgi:hypothetical protein